MEATSVHRVLCTAGHTRPRPEASPTFCVSFLRLQTSVGDRCVGHHGQGQGSFTSSLPAASQVLAQEVGVPQSHDGKLMGVVDR